MLLGGTFSCEVSQTKLPNLLLLSYLLITYLFSGKDDFAPCAANIHVKCVTRMQQDLEKGVSICSSAQNFMKCFEYPEEPCAAEIYADFVIFLKKYASKVLEMFKESPGILPDC